LTLAVTFGAAGEAGGVLTTTAGAAGAFGTAITTAGGVLSCGGAADPVIVHVNVSTSVDPPSVTLAVTTNTPGAVGTPPIDPTPFSDNPGGSP
jgi:hypothetical protein